MNEALELAKDAYLHGEIPVGAVIYCNSRKEIIARANNIVERANLPTKHAEIVAIEQACEFLADKALINCDLYVTLEPCLMCASAIAYARVKRLYYIAPNYNLGAVETYMQYFTQSNCHHRLEIYPMHDTTYAGYEKMLNEFFAHLRK